MTSPLRVTVCQLDSRDSHRAAAVEALAEHARTEASDLVLLPELPFSTWLAVDRTPDLDAWHDGVEQHDAGVRSLAGLGLRAVVATRPTVEADGARHNQAFTWTAGSGAVRVRDKYYLPDEPGYWEASWYDRGALSHATARLAGAVVGVPVCTDLWFMEGARTYARSGVELLCVPRATPAATLPKWLAGGQVAAVCAGAFCLSSNQWVPGGTGTAHGGLGWVVDPDGTVLATTTEVRPFVTVEVDLDVARQAKGTYPRYVRE